jgi:hypothetical protein
MKLSISVAANVALAVALVGMVAYSSGRCCVVHAVVRCVGGGVVSCCDMIW